MAELQSKSSMGEHCKGNTGYSQAGIDLRGQGTDGKRHDDWQCEICNRGTDEEDVHGKEPGRAILVCSKAMSVNGL